MLYPTRRLAWLAALPAAAATAAALALPALLPAVLVLDAALALAAAIDALLAWRAPRRLAADLACPATWSLHRGEELRLGLGNRGRRALAVSVAPDLPADLGGGGAQHLRLPGGSRAELVWRCRPLRRGSHALGGAHAAVDGPLGLWRRTVLLPAPRTVRVYPDLKQLGEYALLARLDRLELLGVRSARRAGGDTEFERLRDWRDGDALARVDWKATARRQQVTVRDYRTSRNQRLVLLVDAGRLMASGADGGGSLLDGAIDAALLLAWLAARQGDRVGLIAYADGVRRWVPPAGGMGQVNRLAHALHDLEPERAESRHEEAFLHLERHERRRALVVVLSGVLDEVGAGHLERHCRRLVGRHLPLAALLQDPALRERLPEGHALGPALAADPQALWRAGAAAAVLAERAALVERLRRHGCLVVDAPPERLTAALVNRYLEVKARGLL